MPTGSATRKAITVTYFYLQTEDDVVPCMGALLSIDWYSNLRAYKINGAANWELDIDDNTAGAASNPNRKLTAILGDVLVWDGSFLSLMRIEDFQTNYTVP